MSNGAKEWPRPRGMSIEAFGKRYGPGRTTTYQEIKSGRLKAHKCGTRTFIFEDDAEDWLRSLPLLHSRPESGK
jgi:hypothetical protein